MRGSGDGIVSFLHAVGCGCAELAFVRVYI